MELYDFTFTYGTYTLTMESTFTKKPREETRNSRNADRRRKSVSKAACAGTVFGVFLVYAVLRVMQASLRGS